MSTEWEQNEINTCVTNWLAENKKKTKDMDERSKREIVKLEKFCDTEIILIEVRLAFD